MAIAIEQGRIRVRNRYPRANPPARIGGCGNMAIRNSPLYLKYSLCVKVVAGTPRKPAGALKDNTIIGRSALFDAIRDTPACGSIVDDDALPPVRREPLKKRALWSDVHKLTVIGAVMNDLGYHKFSDHAWSRQPCGVA